MQQGFVEFGVLGQNFLEIGFGHAQCGGAAMRIGVVGALLAIEDRHIAKPDAGLDIGQRDLLARDGGRAHPDGAFGAGQPFLGRIAPGGDQVAVAVTFDVSASQDVVSQRGGKR